MSRTLLQVKERTSEKEYDIVTMIKKQKPTFESPVDASQIVQDIMVQWPQTIPIFLEHRMKCVGCSMAAFEVLEDALDIYRLSIEPFVEQLNDVIEGTKAEPASRP